MRGAGSSAESRRGAPASKLPPVKHVFVIMLSDEPYASVFGPSTAAPYLSETLERKGELLVRYDAVAHEQLANEVALLSGQGPTAETAANCPNYTDIAPTGAGADEQVLGNGCVYPASTQTLVGQLAAKHLTWRAYVQGIDEGAAAGRVRASAARAGRPDGRCRARAAGPTRPSATRSCTSHSVLDSPACAADDVGLIAA